MRPTAPVRTAAAKPSPRTRRDEAAPLELRMTGVDRQGRSGPELGEEAPEGRVLQQEDGLGVGDLAGVDHPQRRGEGQADNFDVLAFILQPAAAAAGWALDEADIKRQALGHRARAHEAVIGLDQPADGEAGLFSRLLAGTGLGIVAVELAGAGLEQE